MKERLYSAAEERSIREAALDETLANSFPASDPASSIPNPILRDVPKETVGLEGPTATPMDVAPEQFKATALRTGRASAFRAAS